MQPFTIHTGTAFAMQEDGRLMANIDTDMIIPKQFLKTLTRKGLSKGLFYDLRTNVDGEPNADFVLNQPQAQGTSILIAGENFGCGSSREHAPWALKDHGIACVIAPSFADIFHTNCLKNGLLPIVLDAKTCAALAGQSGGNNCRFSIDLSAQTLSAPDGNTHTFAIDSGVKENLLKGRDEIGQALSFEHEIQRFERTRNADMPWLPLMTETHTP